MLAAVALLVAPLRATVACEVADDRAGEGQVAARSVEVAESPHAAHASHVGLSSAAAEPSEHSSPDVPASMPCDDLAACAVLALPAAVVARARLAGVPLAPQVRLATAPVAPVVAVEPPPPRV
ncbi:MAG: hypothetical protein ACKOCV_08730 [Gemmatimonadota bacterium]